MSLCVRVLDLFFFMRQRVVYLCVLRCFKLSPSVSHSPLEEQQHRLSITLTLFQFSCHYHIISYPSTKTPNTQATEVIQLQIETQLSEGLLVVFVMFLKAHSKLISSLSCRYEGFGNEAACKENIKIPGEGKT